MKKIICCCVFVFGLTLRTSFAQPPSEIALAYDPETKVLHIDVAHVSNNHRKHFIRKIMVWTNDDNPMEFDYVNQTTASHTLQDVTLNANPLDVIRVQAICNKAGRKEQTFIIPDAVVQPADQ